jgi:enoyl-[acyl-carrier-protein] reductase (NADH)
VAGSGEFAREVLPALSQRAAERAGDDPFARAPHSTRCAPPAWDVKDGWPVAGAACFLLSDHARAITGEILRVDGGYHAMGAPLR